MTVPLLLSGLASGAVFAVLQSKDTKKALSQLAQGVRKEGPPQEWAQSSSSPVKGVEEPLEAAKDSIARETAQLRKELTAGSALPTPPASAMSAMPAPQPVAADKAQEKSTAEPLTQMAAVTIEKAGASAQVMDAVKEASPAQEQTVAATIQPLREGSFARAPLVDANSVKTKRAKRESSNTIFDLAVETRRRMQAEYERKMMAIRTATAQKQAEEAKRQQQSAATLTRLQSATESQAARERMDAARQEHPSGPFSRMLALLMSVWAWLQHQFSKLIHRSGDVNSSSSGAASRA